MKGFFSAILLIIIITTSIMLTTSITETKINSYFFNDYSNKIIDLKNYELTLNQKGWDHNWELNPNELITDFNNDSALIIKTFENTNCETKNWSAKLNTNPKIITHDINCTTLNTIGKRTHYLNYSKTITIKNKP
ncbi:MAG: hypothetical protein GX950_01230 [Candidatus Diapherotrites archaeon]|jgi:hypothetical protein|uniref:Uncharacterized protein n=1 Tax=Candidatus Iainarchaeum sp. TaxID=3101447 RepID=A0A7K4BZB1_9ARCH|nr:hypothetical protein [Candidatus Diapherotrites archaeon]